MLVKHMLAENYVNKRKKSGFNKTKTKNNRICNLLHVLLQVISIRLCVYFYFVEKNKNFL